MDRIIAKWFIYVVIGLALAYSFTHPEEVRDAGRMLIRDWF
jgi:choline-glycine betaine transporter